MELNIGSNIIRNTSGVLRVEGRDQISLEIGERDDQVLLTMEIYDSEASLIAKLRRNAWVFNNEDRFEVTTSPPSLRLMDKESGNAVVEINVLDRDRVQILRGRFYTHRGQLLEITPQFWRIGDITTTGNVFDGCGQAVVIG